MSTIGSNIEAAMNQAAGAQSATGGIRDREKPRAEKSRRYDDFVELRVADLEDPSAVTDNRESPSNDDGGDPGDERGSIDLRA
ncbi:MAG: hypothetical protein CMJ32_05690 [Phycisphaerae bacterium]|nr:hypothetical protein [Phycisphaerae bacterium]